MGRLCFAALLSLFLSVIPARAQKFSVSTNLADYACLGTLNVEVSYSVSRRWSVTADVKYNPFTFRRGDGAGSFQCRQQAYALGARLWPWHTLSGWWFAGKVKYQEYNVGGIFSPLAKEGDRIGAGLYAGYTHMLSEHFNMEFGLGFWTGMDWYARYSCTSCGLTLSQGRKWFVLPDGLVVSIAYVF